MITSSSVTAPQHSGAESPFNLHGMVKPLFVAAVAFLAAGLPGANARNLLQFYPPQYPPPQFNPGFPNNAGDCSKAGYVPEKQYESALGFAVVFGFLALGLGVWLIKIKCCTKKPDAPNAQELAGLPVGRPVSQSQPVPSHASATDQQSPRPPRFLHSTGGHPQPHTPSGYGQVPDPGYNSAAGPSQPSLQAPAPQKPPGVLDALKNASSGLPQGGKTLAKLAAGAAGTVGAAYVISQIAGGEGGDWEDGGLFPVNEDAAESQYAGGSGLGHYKHLHAGASTIAR